MKGIKKNIFFLVFFSLFIILISPSFGTKFLNPLDLSPIEKTLYFELRLPRVILAIVSGGLLSLAGLILQSIFKNPLVSPYTLGISGGISFVMTFMMLLFFKGEISSFSLYERIFFSALTGLLIVLITIVFSTKKGIGFDYNLMLLGGVSLNFLFSSGIVLLYYISNPETSFVLFKWLFGSFEVIGWSEVIVVSITLILLFILFYLFSIELDLMALSRDLAISKGVKVELFSLIFFGVTILFVSILTSIVGPIGFVGIIVPNLIKQMGIKNHSALIPLSLISGGALVSLSDTIGRSIVSPSEIPPGIITSIVGVPFFVWVIIKEAKVRE